MFLKRNRIIIVALLIVQSCAHNEHKTVEEQVLSEFSRIDRIEILEQVTNDCLEDIWGMVAYSPFLFAYGNSLSGNQVSVTDYSQNNITTSYFVSKGRAKGETSHVSGIQATCDSLFVCVDPWTIWGYSINDVKIKNYLPKIAYEAESLAQSIVRIDGPGFLYIRRNIEDPNNSTIYKKINKNIASSFGEFEQMDVSFPNDDESKHTAWQGKIITSPNLKNALCLFSYAIGFDLINVSSEKITRKMWDVPRVSIQPIPQLKINMVRPQEDFSPIFKDCCASNDFVYLLGKTNKLGCIVLKYNWNGDPISISKLPKEIDIISIAVEENDRNVYLAIRESQGNRIVRYANK